MAACRPVPPLDVPEYPLPYVGVFDAGDDAHPAAAPLAGLDVNSEYALQASRPGHGRTQLGPGELVPAALRRPRPPGVIRDRQQLLGANTPW